MAVVVETAVPLVRSAWSGGADSTWSKLSGQTCGSFCLGASCCLGRQLVDTTRHVCRCWDDGSAKKACNALSRAVGRSIGNQCIRQGLGSTGMDRLWPSGPFHSQGFCCLHFGATAVVDVIEEQFAPRGRSVR